MLPYINILGHNIYTYGIFKSHIFISPNSNINNNFLVDTQLHYNDILLLLLFSC